MVFVANGDAEATIAGVLTAPRPGPGGPQAGGRRAPFGPTAHTPAHLITIAARPDGTFTVTNRRNGFLKTFRPRD